MIQLDSKALTVTENTILNDLQNKVNQEGSFVLRVSKAQSLWDSKGNTAGKKSFEAIRKHLFDLCVFDGICNYCEQSEANDIEHIHPKSFFPEFTFVWDNYLLACKQCNSAYKLDQCYVIDNQDELFQVLRKSEPLYKTHAFINPRSEDPNKFMILNLKTFKFLELPDLSKKDSNRVKATLEILALNERDTLIEARKSAAIFYYQRMDLLVKIINSNTKEAIEELLTPYDNCLDTSLNLDELKDSIKTGFKKQISTWQHPSVWYSIKLVESKINDKWKIIFHHIPDALNW